MKLSPLWSDGLAQPPATHYVIIDTQLLYLIT